MSNSEILSSLAIVSGKPVCSSHDVSSFFDKDHKNVIRDMIGIRMTNDLLCNCSGQCKKEVFNG